MMPYFQCLTNEFIWLQATAIQVTHIVIRAMHIVFFMIQFSDILGQISMSLCRCQQSIIDISGRVK